MGRLNSLSAPPHGVLRLSEADRPVRRFSTAHAILRERSWWHWMLDRHSKSRLPLACGLVLSLLLADAAFSGVRRTGPEFLVNTYTTGSQVGGSIVGLDDDGYVVSWNGAGGTDPGIELQSQRFSPDDSATGRAFGLLNSVGSNDCGQGGPFVASVEPRGEFVVVWDSCDASYYGVYGHRLSPEHAPLGSALQVNAIADRYEVDPDVSGGASGFVVTWL